MLVPTTSEFILSHIYPSMLPSYCTYLEYEELAVSLALDTERLFSLRRHLEDVRDNCAAFDTARWVRNLEKGYLEVWSRREGGLEPADISVIDNGPVFEDNGSDLFG